MTNEQRERLNELRAKHQKEIRRDTEYQTIALDAERNVIHAGVHNARRMNAKTCVKLERKWKVWRVNYDKENNTKRALPKVTHYFIYPCGTNSDLTGKLFKVV